MERKNVLFAITTDLTNTIKRTSNGTAAIQKYSIRIPKRMRNNFTNTRRIRMQRKSDRLFRRLNGIIGKSDRTSSRDKQKHLANSQSEDTK